MAGTGQQEQPALGAALYQLVSELYPICRSLTGDGVRQTLAILARDLPLRITEVATGTPAFDWTVPKEWNIREAWIRSSSGETVVDFARCNLHVVGYSVPVRRRLTLTELKAHVITDPANPEAVPYRTAYYAERWGFCMAHAELERLPEGEYDVCIDSTLADGALTYGEVLLPGRSRDIVLLSTHICHPSLCNDNLSGISVAAGLAQMLRRRDLRYSYCFLFLPATIGPIVWLSQHPDECNRVKHGLVLSGVGDSGRLTYKRTRRGTAEIDGTVEYVLESSGQPYECRDFSPWGYDERQYGSPGINLPVGLFSRTPHGEYPEYHTSLDNLALVTAEALAASCATLLEVVEVLEGNGRFLNTNPKCEPQLGKRGLYRAVAGQVSTPESERALLWVLNFSDGDHSLLDIVRRSRLRFAVIRAAATRLEQHGLLVPLDAPSSSTAHGGSDA